MKLDIKKMALIMGVAIFAFSGIVFGAEGKEGSVLKKIQINNRLKGYQVTIEVNKGTGQTSQSSSTGGGTTNVRMNKIESLNIEIQGEGIRDIKEEIKCMRGQSCRDEMKKRLNDLKGKLKRESIAITAEAEGQDGLRIDLEPETTEDL